MPHNNADFILERGGGTLEKRKGVYIVQLRGTCAQMGEQHAMLAMEICGDALPEYFNNLIEKMVAHAVPALAKPLGAFLKRFFHFRNRERMGEDSIAIMGGLAKIFGVSPKYAERIFFVPDILHYLAGRAFPPLAFPPMCSGFFACGDATKDGKLIIGRNFDFFGRGVWNTSNAIIVMHPDNGQTYCWLGALGSTGSGQGFNESGLVISLHTKFTGDVSTSGVPIFALCQRVLSECATLDEAVAVVKSQPRMVGLTLFVADTKARTAAAIGFSARHLEIVRPENDTLVRTNHYTTEPMRKLEVAPHVWQQNSRGRFQRVTELLAEKHGRLSPTDVPRILSDCIDPFEGCKRVAGSVVAGCNNSQSLVISPDDDAIWIGNADFPVCHSKTFAGFRISALLGGDRENYELEDLAGAGQLDETETEALKEYEDAWSNYNDNLNADQAVYHLRRAAALLPEEVIFPRMAGVLLLKEKKYAQALPLLIKNTEYPYKNDIMRAEAHVWAGRCLDLLKRHSEAVPHYEIAASLDAKTISAAAKRHINSPFKARQLFDVTPEFICGTGLAKY